MLCASCGVEQSRYEFSAAAENWNRPLECKSCNRRRSQSRRHGLNEGQRELIAQAQGGCAICGHPEPTAKGWVVDHDHACCPGEKSCPNCRRGIICGYCNSMLGYAFDRVQTLKAAIAYLEADRACTWHMPVACAPSICTNGTDSTHIAEMDSSNE